MLLQPLREHGSLTLKILKFQIYSTMCGWLAELVTVAMICLNQKGLLKLVQLMGKASDMIPQIQFSTAIEQLAGISWGSGKIL